jgi:dihydrofolate synthase/folylpolyglutamate synthase
MAAIVGTAREVGAPLYVVQGSATIAHAAVSDELRPFVRLLDVDAQIHAPLHTRLLGTFQRQNAHLAAGAALLLAECGLPITESAIQAGLSEARWPARFEVVDGSPPLIIDGAHNGDSAQRLLDSLHEFYPGRPIVLVFGASRNKDFGRILDVLVPAIDGWVLTRSSHPRAMDDLAALREPIANHPTAQPEVPILIEPEPADAIAQARQLAGSNGVVCVTGSLFVAAAAREVLGLAHERD